MIDISVKFQQFNSRVNNTALFYYLLFLILHTLLYCYISNLHNVKISYIFLVLNSMLFVVLITSYFKQPIFLLYHLVFSIVFQNVLVGIGNTFTSYQTSGLNVKLLFIYKELLAGLILIYLFTRYINSLKFIKFEKFFIPLLLWIGFSTIMPSVANWESKFFYIRQYLMVFICYFLGRLIYFSLKNNPKKIYSVFKMTIWLGLLSVIFGIIFNFIGRDSHVWQDWFNLKYVLEAKGLEGGDPNWDTPLGPYLVPRMFSIFFDVITASYFLMVALVCTLFMKKNIPLIFIRVILFVGLLLTLGKGALAIYLLVLVWIFFLYVVKIRPRTFVTPLMSFLTLFFLIAYHSGFRSSAIVHFEGFIQPLLNSPTHPFGNGIGSGGVYYAMLEGIDAWEVSSMGTESFLGSLLYQLGYPGIIFYLVFFIGCIRYMLKFAYKGRIEYKLVVLTGIMFALLLVSSFQEATLGLNYSGILTIVVGFTISLLQECGKFELTSDK
ncbi:hypothetical protein [Priestia megaterium]|uniref:hypothetical protein n=1 Tax=Priestia megaterium TaxID=1404 RepID=UPI000BEB931E|nr:hypothetical protein [Priestia megaterium]MBE2975896.1 hypothetical protein [Priestia megaterium]PEB65264.1 hypothetical protein COM86_05000 [Priestia megaterium]